MLTTHFIPGTPVWIDLAVPNVEGAAVFYGTLLGWDFSSAGPDAGGYGMFTLGGKTVAAAGPLTEPGAAPGWTLYFHTADADATAAAVERAGGAVRVPPMDVFTAGRMAAFTDPAGAAFAVWQPGETKGLDEVTVAGTLCWTELHTPDPAAARSFYEAVFGWEVEDVPMGEFSYALIRPAGGGADSGQGGIVPASADAGQPVTAPGWRVYFEVADCDAVTADAVELGGTVHAAAEDVPGVGRVASLADQFGGRFSVITSVTA
ncbi:MAG TPA: VOC family protein [Streptosporangiaceae bacterium]|nr:VOC family protein [Streptosporangiaceae bacterium]